MKMPRRHGPRGRPPRARRPAAGTPRSRSRTFRGAESARPPGGLYYDHRGRRRTMGKLKAECCGSYKKGDKPCKGCPVMAPLSKQERRELRRKYKKSKKKKKKKKGKKD